MGTGNIDNWGERFGAHDTIAPDSRRADAGSVLICVRQAVSLSCFPEAQLFCKGGTQTQRQANSLSYRD